MQELVLRMVICFEKVCQIKCHFDKKNHAFVYIFISECDADDVPAQCLVDPCAEAKCSKIAEAKCL